MFRTARQIAAARRYAATWPQELEFHGELLHFSSEAPRIGSEASAWYLTDTGRWVRMVRDHAWCMYRTTDYYVPSFNELDSERAHCTAQSTRAARASWADDEHASTEACRF